MNAPIKPRRKPHVDRAQREYLSCKAKQALDAAHREARKKVPEIAVPRSRCVSLTAYINADTPLPPDIQEAYEKVQAFFQAQNAEHEKAHREYSARIRAIEYYYQEEMRKLYHEGPLLETVLFSTPEEALQAINDFIAKINFDEATKEKA